MNTETPSSHPARPSNSPLRALRHHDFARIWGANVVSDIGTWMQLVTIGTLVASRTGSAFRTGLVAVATFAPQAVAAPLAGVLADRHDRRRLLLFVLSAQTVAAACLAAAVQAGLGSSALTGIVLVQGIVGAASNPVAGAMLPDLVPRSALLAASSLQAISWNAGRIAGPILASVLVGVVGPAWSIAANAVSFAVLFVVVYLLRRRFPPAAIDRDERLTKRLRRGATSLRATKSVLFSWQVAMCTQLLIAPMIGLAPIIATRSLHGDRRTVSLLLVCMGIGSIIGSLSVTTLVGYFGRPKTAVALYSAACVLMIAYGRTTSASRAGVLIGLLGLTFIGGHVTVSSVVPRDSPSAERGRIASIYSATVGLCYGMGVMWMGSVGDATSLHLSMTIGGSVAAVLLGLSVVLFRSRWALLAQGDRAPKIAARTAHASHWPSR